MNTLEKICTYSSKECNTCRNYGIDSLRIVSMYMVVVLHVLGVGGVLINLTPFSPSYCIAWILEIASYCAVNCYALISGYVGYGSKHKYSGIVNLTFQVAFYTLVLTALGFLLKGTGELWEVKASLLSAVSGNYWYFTAYFCAFFFFPYINTLMDNLNQKQAKSLVVTMLVLFSVVPVIVNNDIFKTIGGYSPLWLLVMYVCGAYIKKFGVEQGKRPIKYFAMYIFFVLLTFATVAGMTLANSSFGIIREPSFLVSYTSPLIVITGLCLFFVFVNLKPRGVVKRVIAFLSPLTFGVYLIHTQYYSWAYLTDRFTKAAHMNFVYLIFYILFVSFAIYALCSVADYVRVHIFNILKIKELSYKITGQRRK